MIDTAGLLGHLLNRKMDFIILAVMGSTAMIGGYIVAKFSGRVNAITLKIII